MKTILIFLAIIAVTFTSCKESEQKKEPLITKEQIQPSSIQVVSMPINGMSCMSCVATVKRTLSRLSGVKKVNVSLQDKNAIIDYDPERVTLELMQEEINKLGYQAGLPTKLKR